MSQVYRIRHQKSSQNQMHHHSVIPIEYIRIQEVVSDTKDDFVQSYNISKGCSPAIILYTAVILNCLSKISFGKIKDQIENMKYHAKHIDKVTFGIDRTFNLGPLFLTVVNYKNSRLQWRSKNGNPTVIGPMFLHKDATQLQYMHFLSHLKGIYSIIIVNYFRPPLFRR